MAHVTLDVEKRTILGNSVRKVRKQGLLPAVLYGQKITEPITLQLPLNIFEKTFRQVGRTNVLELNFPTDKAKHPCLVHDIDYDPVYGTIRHVDFLEVDLKKKVEAEVPLELVGESPAVKEHGAIVSPQVDTIVVEALPDKIPDKIEIDLSKLDSLDAVIHISDLTATDDYTFVYSEEDDITLVTLSMPRAQEPEEEVSPEEAVDSVVVGDQESTAEGEEKPEENN
jgi:large subunit ribosomal protein L25